MPAPPLFYTASALKLIVRMVLGRRAARSPILTATSLARQKGAERMADPLAMARCSRSPAVASSLQESLPEHREVQTALARASHPCLRNTVASTTPPLPLAT